MVLDHLIALQNEILNSQFICISCISLVCGSMSTISSTSRHDLESMLDDSRETEDFPSEDETQAFYSDDKTAVLSSEVDSNVTDQEEPHNTTTNIPLLSNVHSQKSQVQVYFE